MTKDMTGVTYHVTLSFFIMEVSKTKEALQMINLAITQELILMLLPVVLLQYGLAIYCVIDILRKGTKNLNQVGWIVIVMFINIFGSIAYLTVGKRKDV